MLGAGGSPAQGSGAAPAAMQACRTPPRHAPQTTACSHQGNTPLFGHVTHLLQLRPCLLLLLLLLLLDRRAAAAGQVLELKAPLAVIRRLGRHILPSAKQGTGCDA